MPEIIADTTGLIFIMGAIIASVFLYLNRETKKDDQITKTPPTSLSPSLQQADKIISQAEIEAIKITTEKGMEASLFTQDLQKRLDERINQITDSFDENIKKSQDQLMARLGVIQKDHQVFLSKMQLSAENLQSMAEAEIRTKVNQMLINFEENLSEFFRSSEEKSLNAINLEIQSARQLIDNYKSQQFHIVDENIVAVLEQTINIVLNKKLSLKEQLDMVYEALERAKIEKFLV